MQLTTFRWVAIAEAVTFLGLLVATVVKYSLDNESGVELLGPIHGTLWLAYVVLVLVVRPEAKWGVMMTAAVLLASLVPFGGFVVERRVAAGVAAPAAATSSERSPTP